MSHLLVCVQYLFTASIVAGLIRITDGFFRVPCAIRITALAVCNTVRIVRHCLRSYPETEVGGSVDPQEKISNIPHFEHTK